MFPLLTVSNAADAALVFDALNAAYCSCEDAETRQRLAFLLIAARTEMRRYDSTEGEQS